MINFWRRLWKKKWRVFTPAVLDRCFTQEVFLHWIIRSDVDLPRHLSMNDFYGLHCDGAAETSRGTIINNRCTHSLHTIIQMVYTKCVSVLREGFLSLSLERKRRKSTHTHMHKNKSLDHERVYICNTGHEGNALRHALRMTISILLVAICIPFRVWHAWMPILSTNIRRQHEKKNTKVLENIIFEIPLCSVCVFGDFHGIDETMSTRAFFIVNWRKESLAVQRENKRKKKWASLLRSNEAQSSGQQFSVVTESRVHTRIITGLCYLTVFFFFSSQRIRCQPARWSNQLLFKSQNDCTGS